MQLIPRHLPAAAARLTPISRLSAATRLNLVIGLPLLHPAALSNLLAQIYDPASPDYHHYVTAEEFANRFGPTEADYQAVIAFAKANGLTVTGTHPNRTLVDVNGSVADIEKALHLTMNVYQHPTEPRTFFAPDTDSSLVLAVPVLSISGLDNFSQPRPRLKALPLAQLQNSSPNAGSGPSGTYLGNDFRAAYVPGTSLNGSGQIVGLLQFDGYTASDIAYYENKAGLPSVPLQNILLDGFSGNPTGSGGEVEVSLDIEMAISMATNLSEVIVYEAGPTGSWHDILNRMATDNLARQLSCSWYIPNGGSDPVADQIWQQMAAQGQSFFNASGDDDAYSGLIPFPGDSPYITQVGGTTLTTSGPGGAWVSEKVWNWGDGIGGGGGISTQYPIPNWQTNISMTASQGSTTKRNTPDVALTADQVYVRADSADQLVGGTSCAAPLWAGFAALVNQQAVAAGRPAIGFINPAIDTIGKSANYTSAFHDITTGNNESSGSPTKFSAVAGYDLCTGWGTPAGQGLINALANPEPLLITPATGFAASGGVGGPFTVTSQSLTLTNSGTNTLTWSLVNTSLWLNAAPGGGTLTPGGPAATVTASLNAAASNLVVGAYSATIWFTNLNDNFAQGRSFSLSVLAPPTIILQPTNQAVLDGTTVAFTVAATGGLPLAYQWQYNSNNLTDGGAISGSTTTNLVISNASTNTTGTYSVIVTNLAGVKASSNALLTLISSGPVLTAQPSNQTAVVGTTAQFAVAALGSKPFFYQWAFGTTNIDGATNATLTLTNVQFTQAGSYSVIISNSIGSTLSSNASLTVTTCDPAPAGLVSWWPAEGNAIDVAGTNNGITTAITYTNGEVGQAFVFNGSSSQIRVPASPGLNVGLGNGLTIETWINPASANFQILCEWNQNNGIPSGATQIGVHMEINESTGDGSLVAGVDDTSAIAHNILSPPGVITLNNLQHIAMTYDKTTGIALLYRNGVVVQTANLGTFTPETGYDFFMGNRPSGFFTGSYFVGEMDEPTIYNRALTSNEIATIYNTGSAGKCLSPVGPTITSQPANQTVFIGGIASFGVTASGTSPLSYQWSSNTINILGATNAALTLTNVQLSQAGSYAVSVTNLYGSTFSSNATLTVNPISSCDPPPSGLVSWWPGEGNATDIVGTNNGIITAITYTNGEVRQAFVFNGSSSNIRVPASPSLNVGLGSGLTIETWINPAANNFQILCEWNQNNGVPSGATQIGVHFEINESSGDGSFVGNIDDTAGNSHVIYSPTGVITVNNFQHIAMTYDRTTGIGTLYRNGAVVATTNLGTAFTPQTSYDFFIGYRPSGFVSGQYFNGKMDEPTIYSRALTSNEIAAIYYTGSGGKCVPAQVQPVITFQPTNQTITADGSTSFGVAVSGTLPLSYQWNLNTTNILGATNITLALTNVQLSQAGNYAVLVTNLYGSALSSNAVLTVNDKLDHFLWGQIPSPRFVNVSFPVVIQALGTTNALFTNFTGTVILNSTNGITISPPLSAAFVQGLWTGSITVSQPATNLVLRANDGTGQTGLANAINVVNLPSLGFTRSDNFLLIYWPVASSNFALETSTSLLPPQWVPASPPLQIGDQYLESIQMNTSNQFFRLRLTSP